jgi:hypothetical protein
MSYIILKLMFPSSLPSNIKRLQSHACVGYVWHDHRLRYMYLVLAKANLGYMRNSLLPHSIQTTVVEHVSNVTHIGGIWPQSKLKHSDLLSDDGSGSWTGLEPQPTCDRSGTAPRCRGYGGFTSSCTTESPVSEQRCLRMISSLSTHHASIIRPSSHMSLTMSQKRLVLPPTFEFVMPHSKP